MSQLPVSVSHLNGVYHDSGERMLQLKLDRFHQEEDQKGWQNRNVALSFCLRTKEDPVKSDTGTHFDFCCYSGPGEKCDRKLEIMRCDMR